MTIHLLPHQQRVVKKMLEPDRVGLVVAHGLGSGKTATSIAVQEALGLDADIVVPASLVENYKKEVAKWAPDSKLKRNIITMQSVAKDYNKIPNASLIIIDEGHRGRTEMSATTQRLMRTRCITLKKCLVLTATPFYDQPRDIAPLVEFVRDESTSDDVRLNEEVSDLPLGQDFDYMFVDEIKRHPGWFSILFLGGTKSVERHLTADSYALNILHRALTRYVDYHPNSTVGFPRVVRTEHLVPMSPRQEAEHARLFRQVDPTVASLLAAGAEATNGCSKHINAFLSASRQVCDEWHGDAPKVDAATANLQATLASNPRAKVVAYSGFIQHGIRQLALRLKQANVSFVTFTGEDKRQVRDHAVRDYNAGDVRVLLVSSAGGEGLDLKGTRVVQLIDECWNRSRIEQVEGRAIRYGSHTHLPEGEQEVEVQSYVTTSRSGVTSDQYLVKVASIKEQLLDEFRALLTKEV